MNTAFKEKIKYLILNLPFGVQLLKLRRKILLRGCKKKEKKCKILVNKSYSKLTQQRVAIRKSTKPFEHKAQLLYRKKLRNISYYHSHSVKNLEIFQKYNQTPTELVTAFEIGTGHSLTASIGLSLLGFKKIIATDLCRTSHSYIESVIKFYKKNASRFGFKKCPQFKGKITDADIENFLLQNLNIDYRAPYDSSHTDLPDSSVDYVFANSVFEHIDAGILPGIIQEAFRILRSGGILYTQIDFKDHRSILTTELTAYDYLQYTTEEWLKIDRKINQNYSYKLNDLTLFTAAEFGNQNRLRTSDYQSMFTAAGFDILKIKKTKVTNEDLAAFATVKVADEFKYKYTDDELIERGVSFVLKKP